MRKLFLIITLSLSLSYIYGQGWTTCGTFSGKLSGTLTHITFNQSTSTPIYDTVPSPSGTIPQNDFLIVLHDSLAFDSLGNTIISSNNNGIINPSSLGLIANDTVSIVSFSYDIQQFKLVTQGLFTNSVPFLGSCCYLIDQQSNTNGYCSALNNIGITDSSDINTIQDVINIVSIFKYGAVKPLSLIGLNNALMDINSVMQTMSSIGCTNGVNELCYAFDSSSANHDQYVLTACKASFNYSDSNCIVNFNNNSIGAISYLWDFGDGSQSLLQNPTHTYSSSGTYNVILSTYDSSGVFCDSISQFVTVNCVSLCQASFNYSDSNCIVNFNNNSIGAISSYQWDFGDGTSSNLQNPTHTYSSSGTYNVTLFSINSNGVCCDSVSQYVTVNCGGCQASFSYYSSSWDCQAYFSNTSIGAISYLWDFGDGGQSLLQNPTHTYSSSGTYNVILSSYDSSGVFCDSISQYVNISCSITDIEDEYVPKSKLFPTYIDQHFTIEISGNIHSTYSLEIIDRLGKSIYKTALSENKTIIKRNNIPSGVYLLQLYNGRHRETHKVLFK